MSLWELLADAFKDFDLSKEMELFIDTSAFSLSKESGIFNKKTFSFGGESEIFSKESFSFQEEASLVTDSQNYSFKEESSLVQDLTGFNQEIQVFSEQDYGLHNEYKLFEAPPPEPSVESLMKTHEKRTEEISLESKEEKIEIQQ
jgi:hypothetical protein